MKCYYEELAIARDASEGDIKSSYRKLALRWHPDKNLDCLEEAKERFQLIQQAYEVLSDPQERSWYDNHREQILRGKNSDYEENCLDLFQYFTVSCFKGYGDDTNGFYAVYKEVFEKICAEDAEFMDDEEEIEQIPTFGNSESSYDDVVGPFYAYWQAYCTKKTYTWLCPYDVKEIKDRRVLREIEKELKKIAQKAKKERNEEVRNLVSFIRKRDKRVQAYRRQLEERAELNRQKQEQNRLEQIRKRQRELQEMRQTQNHVFSEGYEAQLKELEQQYGSDSYTDEEYTDDEQEVEASEDFDRIQSEMETYIDDLYCVACNRAFKNEKAFANHETSKKHRENVELMKQEMNEEEGAYRDTQANEEDAKDDVEEEFEQLDLLTDSNTNLAEISDAEEETSTQKKKNRKNKKSKKVQSNGANVMTTSDHEDNSTQFTLDKARASENSDSEVWGNAGKKSAKKNRNKKQTKKVSETMTTQTTVESDAADLPAKIAATVETPKTKTVAAKALTNDTEVSSAANHTCVTCHTKFDSKNKLFAHLKITNHGVYIPKSEPSTASAKKGKGSKRK